LRETSTLVQDESLNYSVESSSACTATNNVLPRLPKHGPASLTAFAAMLRDAIGKPMLVVTRSAATDA
jgi:hypothetical protein